MRNYMKSFAFLGTLVVSFLLVGTLSSYAVKAAGEKKADVPKEKLLPVIEVGGKSITVKDVEDKINSQNPFLRKRYTNPDEKKKFIEGMADFEVLAMEAKALGYEKNPKVQQAMRNAMVQRQMEVILQQRASKESITRKEIEDYYNKHIMEFKRPERRRVAVIVLSDEKKAKEVLKEASQFKNNLRKFQELVRKYSIDDRTKKRGGLMVYFPKDAKNIQKAIVDAAFSLKNTGDLTGPVKIRLDDKGHIAMPGKGTKDAWVIIRLSGISPKIDQSIDDAEPRIRERLWRKKQSEVARSYIKELMDKYKDQIKIHEDKLDLVRVDTSYPRNPFGQRFHNPSRRRGRHGIKVIPPMKARPQHKPAAKPAPKPAPMPAPMK